MKPAIQRAVGLGRILLAASFTASQSFAANDSWIVNAAGNWTAAANWASGTQYPNGAGDIATFSHNITASRIVTLTSAITVGGLLFNDTDAAGQGGTSDKGYGIALGANNLSLDAGTAGYNASDLVLIDVPTSNLVGHGFNASAGGKINFTDNVQINVANNVELSFGSTKFAGAGKLTKTGTGQLLIASDNVAGGYTGNIRVEGGTFQVRSNNNAYGGGVITLTNNSNTRLSANNYSPTAGPVIPNNLILEKTSAANNFQLYLITSPVLTWAGDISNTGPALDVNLTADFENAGLSYTMTKYTGDNSGLSFAPGKGFLGSNNYIGVGNHNALGTGNSMPVSIVSNGTAQVGLLATIPTTITSPITISGNGNVTGAVIGATITGGTVNYTGPITLNAAANNNVRQIFLRSEPGASVVFDSVIGNAASEGNKAPLAKIGGGRTELNGDNTFLGASAVRDGELVLGHANALGSATSAVSLGEATPPLTDVRVATVLSGYAGTLGTWTNDAIHHGTYGVGATPAPAVIDGITLAVGDRILVKDRGNQNGIYVVSSLSPNVWVRAEDLDSSEEISYGQQVRITAGTINGGGVYFQAQRGTGPFPGTITLNSSPLDWHKDTTHPVVSILNNGVAINRDIEVVANGSAGKSILGGVNTSGTSTFSGTVTLARDLAVTADTGGIVDFSGNVTGGFGVTKEGSGKVVFSTAKSYTGATAVTSGTLVINGTLASSGVTVGDGASLQGAGAITNGLAVSGTVSPGDAIGTLTVGSASFTAGGTLEVEIDGPACDQLLSTGALNLSGAALTIKPSGSSVTEPSYVIAQGSPLTGAFANVPGGFTVTYTGSQAILHAASGYFVSPSGSDTTNNGLSAATPFATIQKAANLMVAGDTCFIRGGIYRETVTVPNSGTASSPITFAAYNNEKVIISGTDPITDTWAEESENVWYVDIPYLTREVWTNVTGSSVANIPVGTTPTFTDKLASFETPTNWADNFGTRVSGVFTAPADGDYTFWIASDDNSQLWLSTNSSPANKQLIAAVNSYTISREWTKFPSQKSVAVSLVQGQQYYIEALQKENAGGDNLAVAWARPGQPTTVPSEIIPGSVFSSVPGAFSFTLGDRNQVFQGAGTQASLAMKPEARWPNAGAGHPWQDSTIKPSPDWTYVDSAGYDVNGQNGWLIDAELPSRPAPANYWAGARVHIMLGEGWYTFTPSVNSYDDSTKTLVTDENHGPVDGGGPGAYTMKTGNEYYLTGKKGELDSEGEWFYDNISSRLCFYSTAAPANVEVKSRLYGFKFSGKSFINLTNLDFFACTVDPTAPYPTDCELDGLNMKYLSHHRLRDGAVGLALGSRCVLRNSELAYCSNGLVAMQGSDMRIINNYLHDAAYTPVGVGAIVANVYGANQYAAYRNLISHNTIRKVGHAAITYPGRAAIIQYNDVSDAMKGCTDGGIFYWNQDGSNGIVRYNLVHDSAPAVGHTGAGMRAFYLDNQSSGWIAHHNIIWNVIGHAMHYNARTNFNKIFNNTCWNCSGGAVQSHFWGDGPTGSSFFNNLFNGKADGNQATWSVTDMRHNLHTDPSLVDPANRDFRLQASSPGIDAGTVIPGVTDGYAGSAPDLGALEYGVPDWTDRAGYHAIPPTPDPVHDAPSLSFANQISDGSFESGNLATAWVTAAGSNVGVIRSSSWYDPHLRSGHHGVQFGGGESEISQVVTGLIPNRRYKFHCGTHKTDPSAVVVLGVRSFGFPDREFTVPVTNPWQQNVADPVGVIFEVPFVTGPTDTSATVYVKVTRPAGSSVAPKNNTTGTFPTTAATLINLSNYYNSVLVNPWYPETGVYVDDLAVLLSQENTDPLTYGMPAVSYPFDESGGVTAYDVTPNENSAVLTGATFTPGQHGNALTFTGITQKATATTATIPAAGGSFSVAFWLKLNNIAANEYPKPVNNAGWLKKGWHITSGPDYSLAMYLWTKDNSQGTDNPKTGISCSTQALAAGVWAHVTFVFDRANGVVKSFRNGKLTNTATIPAGFGDIATTGGLQIGTGFSNGQMDDFQLWNYALNDKAVADVIGTDPSLALRLKLDDEAGATKAWDSSSYRRTGDLTNMTPASAWVGGRINGALEFDGVNDHVATPAISSPEAVTVACWAKSATPAWNASGCLVSQRPAFVLSPEQGGKNLRFIIYDSPTTEIATPTWVPPADFDITLWHHYAGVFDPAAGRLELYVDGVLVSFLSTTATLNADTGAVFIGKDDNAANYFNGAVDDVRIHSRALSWWEMLELSLQINTQPYAETPTIILATDVDGDRLPGAWEQFYGLDPQVANNPADDSGDHDGLGLLMEYALNQNPSSDSSAGLPIINTELNPGDGKTYLTFTYLRRTDAPQVTYAVQVSDDLLSWSSAPAESLEISAVPSGDGVTEIVTTRILPAIGASNPRRMARLSVSPP